MHDRAPDRRCGLRSRSPTREEDGALTEPFPFSDDVPGWCWQSPPQMTVGRWIEIPVDDDGLPRWMRVEVLMSPLQTMEYRWAVRAGRDGEHYWMKIAPWLRFRSADHDPSGLG